MIVLDEQLQGIRLEAALKRWYRGRVCIITDLRPGIVIKDEMIPRLLRAVSEATFVTVNARHFWDVISAVLYLASDRQHGFRPYPRRRRRLGAA
jgi:hypothetical protein